LRLSVKHAGLGLGWSRGGMPFFIFIFLPSELNLQKTPKVRNLRSDSRFALYMIMGMRLRMSYTPT
jgi:hypothetical protein